MTRIPTCDAGDDPDSMYSALDEAGCLVVRDMASSDQVAAVRQELAEHMGAADVDEDDPEEFFPGHTRRVVALAHRSPMCREFVMDPRIEALGDRHLGLNSPNWTLNVSAAVEIGPGSRDQVLHREEDLYPYWELPRPNLILATMWAISEFTVDNGGTQLVPGSHRWTGDRQAEPHEVVRAEMDAGSVLLWLGGTLHGGGANVTADQWRYGVILTYNLGWLRQEESQLVSMPLADALALPDAVQSRLGFGMSYGGGLGFYDPSILSPQAVDWDRA